jgi:uncharacterized membrane protein YhaH (DUF805 family)
MDVQAIFDNFRRAVTEHYFDMNGRVGRAQFWYFVLAYVVVSIGLAFVQMALFFLPIVGLFGLAMLLPAAGMGARRLQDIGQNGQLVWIAIIPSLIIQLFGLLMWGPFGALGFLAFYFSIGWLLHTVAVIAGLVAIYFWCQPGDPVPNAYGPPPPRFDPSTRPVA